METTSETTAVEAASAVKAAATSTTVEATTAAASAMPPPRTSVVSPPEAAFAVGAAPGLISDSACARCGTVESASIAAAARPKEYRKRRATPRRGFEILIMCEASLNSGNESPGHQMA